MKHMTTSLTSGHDTSTVCTGSYFCLLRTSPWIMAFPLEYYLAGAEIKSKYYQHSKLSVEVIMDFVLTDQ